MRSRRAGQQPGPLRRTLGILRPHLHGHRLLLAGGAALLLLEVVMRVLEPWPIKIVIDALTRSLGADLAHNGPRASWQLLGACALITVALVGLRAVFNFGSTVLFALGGSRIATALRTRVFGHVQALPRAFHLGAKSGDLVQRLISDVNRLQEVTVTAGLPLAANVFTLVAMLGVMTWLDPSMSLIVLGAIVVFVLYSYPSGAKITDASRKTRRNEGDLASIAQETIGGMGLVQTYNLQGERSRRFDGSNTKSLREGVKAKRLAAALERRTDVLVGLATAAVLLLGGMRVLQGHITPGDLVLFLTYLKTTMKPLRDLSKYIGRISRAAASGERVADLLDQQSDIASPAYPRKLTGVRGELELRGVHLTFGDGVPVLRGLDLHVPAGQQIALVGSSGAGKSTIATLLVRMVDPQQGAVLLDGVDVRELGLGQLRDCVALVQQDAVLFSGSIAENIAQGRPGASMEDIRRAATMARADEFISLLPAGYQSLLGERGATLSGGQRQRISLARAFLKDAPVLILDEPTTGLDSNNADLVREAVTELARGRTTILVTHDDITARGCERIVWIERGRIRADGPADSLSLPSDVVGSDA